MELKKFFVFGFAPDDRPGRGRKKLLSTRTMMAKT